MKKVFGLCIAAMLAVAATGCGTSSSTNPSSPSQQDGKQSSAVKLEMMTNADDRILKEYQAIADQFHQENPNITVDVSSQGKDFESLIKAKMASGDLPDMWTTHGWSVMRYSKFLLPLNDQPWFGNVSKQILPIISNDKGQIFVLPLDIDESGVVVNKTVLDKSGVSIDSLSSWNDFVTAFEKIKRSGYTPVGFGGKDPRDFAGFLDRMATPLYISSPSHAYGNNLNDGNFDWSKWNAISDMLSDLQKKGFLNKDAMTADGGVVQQAMAKDQIAFLFGSNSAVQAVLELNPKANIGFIPLPAYYPDDKRQLVGGERDAVGIWKDSKHKEEALKFLNYLAKDVNVKRIATAQGMVAGLTNATSDLGALANDYAKYKDVPVFNYFDRIYLPSGMWSVMQQVGAGLVSGQMTADDASKTMKQSYDKLRSQNQ